MFKRYIFKRKIESEINSTSVEREKLSENLSTAWRRRKFNKCKTKEVNLVALLSKIMTKNISNKEIQERYDTIMRD